MTAHGTYTTVDGRPAVRFERRLDHPAGAVWRMVTDPDELRHWFPCEVALEPRVGGAMRFTFSPDFTMDGVVVELDAPRRFAFRWGADLLRFELDPDGDGTRLVLLHVLYEEDEDAAAKTAAGWHLCLDAMGRRLDGEDAPAPEGRSPEWDARYEEYVARGVPAGAEIPRNAGPEGQVPSREFAQGANPAAG
jgi:uncharacterized protein YndB with AHSA1/START domain